MMNSLCFLCVCYDEFTLFPMCLQEKLRTSKTMFIYMCKGYAYLTL